MSDRRTVGVVTSSKSYDVIAGEGLLGELGTLLGGLLGGTARLAMVIADDKLPAETVATCRTSLEAGGLGVVVEPVRASESNKVLSEVQRLCGRAAGAGLSRSDLIVALGGGIVGDVGGFVAATYQRGLRVVQCPTTLLAMVDASVGGKTGVNLLHESSLLKNYVGSFHQPELVLASTDTLASLPAREFRAGLAECIKHAMISADWGDPELWDWTSDRLPAVLSQEHDVLVELVARNVSVKANVVGSDEREMKADGGRALLNLGHTFAHAIETLPELSPGDDASQAPLLHGEAVALGMAAACVTASTLGLLDDSEAVRVRNLLEQAGLPVRVRNLPAPDLILQRMVRDKKALAGAIRLVLPTGRGRAQVVHSPDPDAIVEGIEAISSR